MLSALSWLDEIWKSDLCLRGCAAAPKKPHKCRSSPCQLGRIVKFGLQLVVEAALMLKQQL